MGSTLSEHKWSNSRKRRGADGQMMSWLPSQNLVTTGTIYFYNHDGTHMSVTVNGSGPVSQVSFTLNAAAMSRLDLTFYRFGRVRLGARSHR